MRRCGWFFGPFNPHANDADGLEMERKYGAGRRADGARQTTRAGGRTEDAGTHTPPAHRLGSGWATFGLDFPVELIDQILFE